MKILGVSGSRRVWGNTDILVQQTLRSAAAEGAETRFLRLTDLDLESCQGCMACVFRDRDCVIEDRLPEFLEALRWADALVLGSPTYVLGATGAVKNLHDRLIRYGIKREFVGKLGVAVAAAGVPGWEPFALPQLSLLLLFLGMPVVDQFVGYAQGPGEILASSAAMERAARAGRALGLGKGAFLGDPGLCPVCHLGLVAPEVEGARCLLCDLPGRTVSEGGSLRFEPSPGVLPRWSDEMMRHHFHDRVLPSGPRFKERLREIRAAVAEFRGRDS